MSKQVQPNVEDNIGLIYKFGRCYVRGSLKIGDRIKDTEIFAEGSIGLMKACKHFDPKRGNKFSTYAGACINRKMMRQVNKERCRRKREALVKYRLDSENDLVADYRNCENNHAEMMIVRYLFLKIANFPCKTASERKERSIALKILTGEITIRKLAKQYKSSYRSICKTVNRFINKLKTSDRFEDLESVYRQLNYIQV